MLDNYSKAELIHIVDMYDLDIDISKLKKSKEAIKKEMLKGGSKKTLKENKENLPDKPTIKKMVEKDKKKKSSLLNKVNESGTYKKNLDKKTKDMTPEEKKEYQRLRTKDSRAKKKAPKKEDKGKKDPLKLGY
tara:strand:+ start:25 stop:423 length:399 start_codon:yes stop_codon:yes gene_type:complete